MVSRFLLTLTALLLLPLPAAAQPETSKLRISAVPIAGFTPIYAADKLGFFKQEGLEVTIDRAAGGAQTVPSRAGHAAIGGDADRLGCTRQSTGVQPADHSAVTGRKANVPGQTAQIVLAEALSSRPPI